MKEYEQFKKDIRSFRKKPLKPFISKIMKNGKYVESGQTLSD